MRSLYIVPLISVFLATTACVRQTVETDVVDETYVHKYGVAVPPDFWESSGEHGSVISTMADGVVISRSYNSGILSGETTYSYPHSSQTQKKEAYDEGILNKETEYFLDGIPRKETVYPSSSAELKTVSEWYLSGTPKSIEKYQGSDIIQGDYYDMFNQRDSIVENGEGTRLVRDDYGQRVATESIKNGQVNLRTTYHQNGSPKEMIPFENGQIHGTKSTFHPGGEPRTVEQWRENVQHGITTEYQQGEKFAEVPYVDGKKHGIERRYRDAQDIVQEISWKNNKLHGPTTTYIGDTSKMDWYHQGNQVSKTDYDFLINKPVAR